MSKIKLVINIFFFFFFFLNPSFVLAENSKSSNQYEIEIIEKLISEIDNVKSDDVVKYILNLDYDLYNRKDKMYSNCIIRKLVSKICKEVPFYTIKNPNVLAYINENENNEIYDDQNVWKKIKTWVLLRPGLMELENKNSVEEQEDEYERFLKRRNDLLGKIIKNRSDYTLILTYLLLLDGAELDYEERPADFLTCEENLKKLIIDYPNSEFAYYATQQLASYYDIKGDSQKAIEELEKLINNTSNFYSGAGDFHSSIAGELLTLYRNEGNKEKIL